MLAAEDSWPGHLSLLGNGSLVIEEFGWRDRGEYSCYVDNMLGNDTQSVQLELEPRYRHVIYMWSLLYGLVTAVSFLGNRNIPILEFQGPTGPSVLHPAGSCGALPSTSPLKTMVCLPFGPLICF